jgi:hypothetical protein
MKESHQNLFDGQKIKPESMREVLEQNPDIKQNEEYFLIPIEINGKKETHYIPKRDTIDVKFSDNNIVKVEVAEVIKATKKYPDKSLSEALNLIRKNQG